MCVTCFLRIYVSNTNRWAWSWMHVSKAGLKSSRLSPAWCPGVCLVWSTSSFTHSAVVGQSLSPVARLSSSFPEPRVAFTFWWLIKMISHRVGGSCFLFPRLFEVLWNSRVGAHGSAAVCRLLLQSREGIKTWSLVSGLSLLHITGNLRGVEPFLDFPASSRSETLRSWINWPRGAIWRLHLQRTNGSLSHL